MKRTVELDDTLQELVDEATEELKDLILEHLKENPGKDEAPDLNDLDESGAFHELVDSSVPVYTHEIDTIFYLHGSRVESAFDDAGIGEKDNDKWPCGDWRMAAIYCYIEAECREWYAKEAEGIFEEWQADQMIGDAESKETEQTDESEATND